MEKVLESFHDEIEVIDLKLLSDPVPFYPQYLVDGDAEAYKTKLMAFFKVIMRNPVLNMLANRNNDEKEEIFRLCLEEAINLVTFEEFKIESIALAFKKIKDNS